MKAPGNATAAPVDDGKSATEKPEVCLVVDQLVAGYGKLPVLQGLSLTLAKGSMTAIIGPNGAGKTTLVRAIVNIADIMEGSITFEGVTITGVPAHEIAARGVGFMPQSDNVFATLTVQENLEMGCRFVANSARASVIDEAYTIFPRLRERRLQRARTLSGGERQMLAIASVLLAKPRLLILDEPVSGLSPQLTNEVVASIKALNGQGTSVLWIVEENPIQVLERVDWVYAMEGGTVRMSAPAAAFLAAKDFRQIFLGG